MTESSAAGGVAGVRRALRAMLSAEAAAALAGVPEDQLEVAVLAAAAHHHHTDVLRQLAALQEGRPLPAEPCSPGSLTETRPAADSSPPLSPTSPKLGGWNGTSTTMAPVSPGFGEQLGWRLGRCRTTQEKLVELQREALLLADLISETSVGQAVSGDAVATLETRANALWGLLEAVRGTGAEALRRDCDHLHRQAALMLARLGGPEPSRADLDRQLMEAVLKPRAQYWSDQLDKVKQQLAAREDEMRRADQQHREEVSALRQATSEALRQRDAEIQHLHAKLHQVEHTAAQERDESQRWKAQQTEPAAELAEARAAMRRLEDRLAAQRMEAQRQLADLQESFERQASARVRRLMSIVGEEVEVEGEADSEVVRAFAERICALEK
eukprot:EG_transcript_14627